MKVEVVRAFLLHGLRQEVGSIVEMPDHLGREAMYMGKAKAAPGEVLEQPSGPMTMQNTPAVVRRGRPPREK
jgi:hypothetical protein